MLNMSGWLHMEAFLGLPIPKTRSIILEWQVPAWMKQPCLMQRMNYLKGGLISLKVAQFQLLSHNSCKW